MPFSTVLTQLDSALLHGGANRFIANSFSTTQMNRSKIGRRDCACYPTSNLKTSMRRYGISVVCFHRLIDHAVALHQANNQQAVIDLDERSAIHE